MAAPSSLSPDPQALSVARARRSLADRIGDPTLRSLTVLASLAAVVLLVLIVYKVFAQAGESFSHFGLSFIWKTEWNPVTKRFGAADFLYGTAVSTFAAILIAAPMSIAIALFLTELAPRQIRRPVGVLVELLAAIPSVVLGLWGIIVLSPVLIKTIEPALKSVLGWIPLFSGEASPVGMLPAILILTIMAVPIISAVTREVFETVPGDLKEGALALGATRWEMVKMVILPYSRTGIVGATILGLGRALGEAIAVTMVIGHTEHISADLFGPADTLASRLASEYLGATSSLQISSLAYLAAILLVLALIVNVIARLIVRRAHPKIPTTPGILR